MAPPCYRFSVPVTQYRAPPKGQKAEHYTNACGVYALWFLVLGLFWPAQLTGGQLGAGFWPTHAGADSMRKNVHQISQVCCVALVLFPVLTIVCCCRPQRNSLVFALCKR